MDTGDNGLVIKALEIRNKPFHVSENLRILYVLKGTLGLEFVAGRCYLTEGNIEIINIDEPVKLFSESGEENVVLVFEVERETAKSLQPLIDKALYNCSTTLFYPSKATKNHQQQLRAKLLLIYNLYVNTADDTLMIKTVQEAEDLIVEYFHDFKNMLADSGVSDARLNRFLRIYDSIYMNAAELNLRKLADNEYVSVQYLSKEFNEKLNVNFKATVEYYKVIQAVRYLITTCMPVTQVSENSGFSAPRYFYKQFSAYLKCTPVAFRDRLKAEEEQLLWLTPYDDKIRKLVEKKASFNLGVFKDEEDYHEISTPETGRSETAAADKLEDILSAVYEMKGGQPASAAKFIILSPQEKAKIESLLGEDIGENVLAVMIDGRGKSAGKLVHDAEEALNCLSLFLDTASAGGIEADFRWDVSSLSEEIDQALGYEPTNVIVGLLSVR